MKAKNDLKPYSLVLSKKKRELLEMINNAAELLRF